MLPTEALSLPSKGCFRRAAPNSRPCSASVKHFYPTVSTNLHMVKNRLFQISTHPPSKTLGLFQQMEKYFKILKGTSLIPQFWLLLKSCIKIWLQGRVKRGAKGNEQKAKGVKKKKTKPKKTYFALILQAKPNIKHFPLLLFKPDPPSKTDTLAGLPPSGICLWRSTLWSSQVDQQGVHSTSSSHRVLVVAEGFCMQPSQTQTPGLQR